MTSYLVLDTNALPIKGGFNRSFWTALFRLCEMALIQPAICEISIEEAVNLRRDTAAQVISSLMTTHSKLSGLTVLAPIYVPSAEDVAREYEESLRARVEILALKGDHAREALFREARRIPPARNGTGGRDTAIWLTLVSLAEAGHKVHFVTNNTKDFGKGQLAPTLRNADYWTKGVHLILSHPKQFS